MNKECPLRAKSAWPKCMGRECAWYLVRSKQCAIPLIASNMQSLAKFYDVTKLIVTEKVKAG